MKPSDRDDFEQDDYVKIEIEKQPDGTLMALRIITDDNDGTRNPGTRGAKHTTTTTTDDPHVESCVDEITTGSSTTTEVTTSSATAPTGTLAYDPVDPSVERALVAIEVDDGRLGDGARLPAIRVLQVCQATTTSTTNTTSSDPT